MVHVFISYKHTDSEDFARSLRQELENAGFEVWWDDDIPAGEDWRKEIDQAIEAAFALVVIMTPEARQSEYVTYEWACALGSEKPIIPLLWKPTGLHPRLEAFQYIDFVHSDYQPALDKLIKRLQVAEEQSTMYKVPRDAPPAVKRAVAALDSHRVVERREALETLAQIDHPSAREALVVSLQHHVQDVRFYAIDLLNGVLARPDVHAMPGIEMLIPRIVAALGCQEEHMRAGAAELLGTIRDESTVPVLIGAVNDEFGFVSSSKAVKALEKIGTPEALAVAEKWRRDHRPYGK